MNIYKRKYAKDKRKKLKKKKKKGFEMCELVFVYSLHYLYNDL